MGVLEIKDYVVGIILFMIVVVSVIYISQTFVDNDENGYMSQDQLDKFDSLFNKSSDVIEQTNSLKSNVESSNNTDFGTFGVLNALAGSSWQAIKVTTTSWSFMEKILFGLSDMFLIPRWLMSFIYSIILIIIIFSIYDAIFGGVGR